MKITFSHLLIGLIGVTVVGMRWYAFGTDALLSYIVDNAGLILTVFGIIYAATELSNSAEATKSATAVKSCELEIRDKELIVQQETNRIKNEEINALREQTAMDNKLRNRELYLTTILPLQKKLITELEAVASMPLRNSSDWLNLRIKPEWTIEFDEHQPLIREKSNPPKNNALCTTLYDRLREMRGEIVCLFPDLVSEYDVFLMNIQELHKASWNLKSTDKSKRYTAVEREPAVAQKTLDTYESLRQHMIESMSKAMHLE